MSIFTKMRDATFNFIEREGDFTLHFFADFVRGHSPNKHRKQKLKEEPLTKKEQAVFKQILKRRKNETQIEYWKREKAMLNMKDKKAFIKRAMDDKKQQEKSKIKDKNKERLFMAEKEKRRRQLQKMKIAKSNTKRSELKR